MNTVIRRKKIEKRTNIYGDTMIFAEDIAFWPNKKEKLEQALAVLNVCMIEAGLKRNIRNAENFTISKTLGEPVDNKI